ncbi:Kae1-associated serine/threonine protein kinase [Candidatus Woesearchaeota archaeon]|nr:Kae1-associated serine/threonine protein kinase [Candidatus Woesearchaeota archaeon]
MAWKELARGAEAIIYEQEDTIIKQRPRKTYRHPALDQELRTQRTRKEAKVLRDLERLGIPAPKLITADDKEGRITMARLRGDKLRDVLNDDTPLCEQVGRHVATMHDHDLLHGDLTTSNMLVINGEVSIIDFGLSFHSTRDEDKAVDLHLFRQALTSKHHDVTDEAWEAFLKGYRPLKRERILQRLRIVEQRGRNKA